jgi:hypothetical protein
LAKLFLILGLIGFAIALGFVPLAIRGIVDTESIKIFPQMTFAVNVITFVMLGVVLLGLARVLFVLDRIEKGRP